MAPVRPTTARVALYGAWSLLLCPAIGSAVAILAGFPNDDGVILSLFLVLPCALAVVGGALARVGPGWITAGALLAPPVGLFCLLAILGATQGG